MIDFNTARWHKATASDHQGDCVEVARLGDRCGVRDSKSPDAAMLVFPAAAFATFTAALCAGEFD
ncbi:MAG: DUF397 domain-containing protein [Streptosporangiales bacterium]|nr:DUF397 domain-containing protein [Streptosporangiales bacterium]